MPRASKEAAQIPAIAEDQPAAEAAVLEDSVSVAATEEPSQAQDFASSHAGQQDSQAEVHQEASVADSAAAEPAAEYSEGQPAYTESQADLAEPASEATYAEQAEGIEAEESQAEPAEPAEPSPEPSYAQQEPSEAPAEEEELGAEMSQQDIIPEEPQAEQPPPETQQSSRPAYKPSETFSQVLDSLKDEIAESGTAQWQALDVGHLASCML